MVIPPADSAKSDERIMAALAHGSVMLFGWGFFAPLIIWITYRKKSTFVTFHALQALVYQLFQTVYWWIYYGILITGVVIGMMASFTAAEQTGDLSSPYGFISLQIIFLAGIFLGFALYALFGVLGAILTLARKDYRYPILGRWLERYLSRPPVSGGNASKPITGEPVPGSPEE
jgi:uncharacterized Tic20 family protein